MIKVRFGYQGYDDSLWILIEDVDNLEDMREIVHIYTKQKRETIF